MIPWQFEMKKTALFSSDKNSFLSSEILFLATARYDVRFLKHLKSHTHITCSTDVVMATEEIHTSRCEYLKVHVV